MKVEAAKTFVGDIAFIDSGFHCLSGPDDAECMLNDFHLGENLQEELVSSGCVKTAE